MKFDQWWEEEGSAIYQRHEGYTVALEAWNAAQSIDPEGATITVYQCPQCGTGMEVDPSAKPSTRRTDDVERYEWLRRKLVGGITVHYDQSLGKELIDILGTVSGNQFDAAVDRAIASECSPQKESS